MYTGLEDPLSYDNLLTVFTRWRKFVFESWLAHPGNVSFNRVSNKVSLIIGTFLLVAFVLGPDLSIERSFEGTCVRSSHSKYSGPTAVHSWAMLKRERLMRNYQGLPEKQENWLPKFTLTAFVF